MLLADIVPFLNYYVMVGFFLMYYTLMRPLDAPGVLAEIVAELPHGRPLRAAKIHTATDGRLVIDTFEFGEAEPFDASDPAQLAKLEAMGIRPYPHGFERSHRLAEVVAGGDAAVEASLEVQVAGRLMSSRRHGKIAFANLADEITYYSHDLDDGFDYNLISEEQLEEIGHGGRGKPARLFARPG